MKSHYRAVVIGGGVVGCSVLYHLTKKGWSDILLIERDELTSGSTWHAAGGFHTLNGDPNVAKLQEYTIGLYKEIEEVSGQSTGIHITGGVMLVSTPERYDWLKMAHARNKYLGVATRMISVEEAREHFPLLDPSKFLGAMWHPLEGHLDPSGTTHAYAKAARVNGAEIVRKNRVLETNQIEDGKWQVVTEQGTVTCEHLVNAGGLWGREVGRMAGLEIPSLCMAHQYLITEEMEEVVAYNKAHDGKKVVHCIDFDGEIYMRQEGKGMLMGTYEPNGIPWSPKEAPWGFSTELLPPDLDQIADNLERGFAHHPAFQKTGIKNVIHGPFAFGPDGNPLVGPIRGLQNYWVACGVMAGFSQGGGVGLALSNWIVDGDPGFDVWAMDIARYGSYANMAFTNAKVRENYGRRFRIMFPNEELKAARPLRTTPLYDRFKAMGAFFGVAYGVENALWFAPQGKTPEEPVTFRRPESFQYVGDECRAVRTSAGCLEISGYAKYEITGPGAEGWLSHLLANKVPPAGRMTLAPMLNERGKLIGDFSLAKLDDERFYIFGSGAAENYHMRWFEQHLPDDGSVRVRALGLDLCGLSIAGPNARRIIAKLTDEDVSTSAFPFMAFREMELGLVPAMVGRVSFTGSLGYEIWVKPEYLTTLHSHIMAAGEEFAIRQVGGRALMSLRLEKNWGTWAREYRPIYGPYEAGLGRFVALSKNDFIGREAAAREKETGGARALTVFTVAGSEVDVIGDEPVYHNGNCVGWITSGGYAHAAGKSVAMGYIPRELVNESNGFEIEILGQIYKAIPQAEPLYDADASLMRA
ncbi:MAG: FAD-dependent oxidoreductase [Anderseniella sp.]|jgi:dimethylglycine dehydrogenase|nr:FAD-dependent oxidoreductase [Anderseniella sp.]